MTRTNLLPTTDRERTISDTQRTDFTKQTYEKEAAQLGLHDTNKKPLTQRQIQLLDKIRTLDAVPPSSTPHVTTRTAEQVAASVEIQMEQTVSSRSSVEISMYIAEPTATSLAESSSSSSPSSL